MFFKLHWSCISLKSPYSCFICILIRWGGGGEVTWVNFLLGMWHLRTLYPIIVNFWSIYRPHLSPPASYSLVGILTHFVDSILVTFRQIIFSLSKSRKCATQFIENAWQSGPIIVRSSLENSTLIQRHIPCSPLLGSAPPLRDFDANYLYYLIFRCTMQVTEVTLVRCNDGLLDTIFSQNTNKCSLCSHV